MDRELILQPQQTVFGQPVRRGGLYKRGDERYLRLLVHTRYAPYRARVGGLRGTGAVSGIVSSSLRSRGWAASRRSSRARGPRIARSSRSSRAIAVAVTPSRAASWACERPST